MFAYVRFFQSLREIRNLRIFREEKLYISLRLKQAENFTLSKIQLKCAHNFNEEFAL